MRLRTEVVAAITTLNQEDYLAVVRTRTPQAVAFPETTEVEVNHMPIHLHRDKVMRILPRLDRITPTRHLDKIMATRHQDKIMAHQVAVTDTRPREDSLATAQAEEAATLTSLRTLQMFTTTITTAHLSR